MKLIKQRSLSMNDVKVFPMIIVTKSTIFWAGWSITIFWMSHHCWMQLKHVSKVFMHISSLTQCSIFHYLRWRSKQCSAIMTSQCPWFSVLIATTSEISSEIILLVGWLTAFTDTSTWQTHHHQRIQSFHHRIIVSPLFPSSTSIRCIWQVNWNQCLWHLAWNGL